MTTGFVKALPELVAWMLEKILFCGDHTKSWPSMTSSIYACDEYVRCFESYTHPKKAEISTAKQNAGKQC